MKKIFFPFELNNPVYREAYVYAIKFARNVNAGLIILNTFKLDVGDDITQEKYDHLKKQNWIKAYNQISAFNKYYLEDNASVYSDLKIRFDYRFIYGIYADEIRNIAREETVDLMVLPTSENKEFNKRQLRIISDNVFEKNRISLLVIPQPLKYSDIKKIVFATDWRKLNQYKQYINEVIHYASVFDSDIHFLHISPSEKAAAWEDSETFQLLKEVIEQNNRHSFQSIYGKDVIESVNHYVLEHQADLLVVVKHQHYFHETLFHESISKKISLNSKVPVMIMREKGD